MNNDEALVWPLVIIIVAYFLYKNTQTTAAANLAQAQLTLQQQQAAANNPWLGVAAGVGAISSLTNNFANLFADND